MKCCFRPLETGLERIPGADKKTCDVGWIERDRGPEAEKSPLPLGESKGEGDKISVTEVAYCVFDLCPGNAELQLGMWGRAALAHEMPLPS